MSDSIPVTVTRSSLTIKECPPELADALAYVRQNVSFDQGNFRTTPERVSYAHYEAQTRTCRTYPNALHLVEAAARGLRLALEINDQRLRPPLDLSRVNQAEYPAVCYQALETVAQARSSGIVVAPAGAGTTLLVCGLVRMLPRHFKVLVTADEKTVAQQIHAALAEALSEEKIGIHMPRRSERGRIMVTHLDALKDFVQGDLAYGGYALREFDAWICDEVHRLPVPGRIPFLNQFRPTYCWGLTATPVRADNSHELNSVVFGPALLAKSADGTLEIQAGAGKKGIVPLRVFVFPLLTPRPLAEGLSLYELTRAAYLKNPALGATLQGIHSRLPEAAKVLVCADTVRLGIILRGQLPQYTLVHRRQSPEYRQDVLQRLRAGELRRVLCADLGSEGIDVPDLDYVIDCSGKPWPSLMMQSAGRATCNAPGQRHGRYLMLLCLGSRHLFNLGVSKLQNLNRRGWEVSYMFPREVADNLPFEAAPLLPELGTFPEG
jgi:superfamily II DNA or RNA helicase